jgi:hypothetical protein
MLKHRSHFKVVLLGRRLPPKIIKWDKTSCYTFKAQHNRSHKFNRICKGKTVLIPEYN